MASVAPPANQADVAMLKDEQGGLTYEEGITTVTFFKGDFTAAASALKVQFAAVVAANPWLAGRLVKTKEGVVLRHPTVPTDSDIGAIFTSDQSSKPVSTEEKYVDTCAKLFKEKKFVVGMGYYLIGSPDPVVKLSIVGCSGGSANSFAVIFSMSHAIGDAKTHYDVLKMTSPAVGTTGVRTLVSERIQAFSTASKEQCGKEELAWMEKPSTAIMYELSLNSPCGPAVKCFGYYLDEARIVSMKKEGKTDGVEYVTTNDILTSGFFKACKTTVGTMGIDLRGKLNGYGDDLAGNYVSVLTMDETTFGTPAKVRKMMTSGPPWKARNNPLPSFCGWLVGKDSINSAMATNWSSFAGNLIEFEGCELELHMPLFNPAYNYYDKLIPFAAGNGRKGVVMFVKYGDEAGIKDAMPVGDSINSKMFP